MGSFIPNNVFLVASISMFNIRVGIEDVTDLSLKAINRNIWRHLLTSTRPLSKELIAGLVEINEAISIHIGVFYDDVND